MASFCGPFVSPSRRISVRISSNVKGIILTISGLLLLAKPAGVQAQFNYTTNNGTIVITGYTGSGGAVTIPSTINGLPVSSINDFAFVNNSNLTSVTTLNNLTSIGNYAFPDRSV